MRSHPASGTALVCGCLARLFTAARQRHARSETALTRECSFLRTPCESKVHGLSPQASLAQIAQADGSVLPRGGPSEEAATPTFPKHAMKAYALNTPWETLRQFTLENRRKRQLDRNPTALSRHLTFALAVLCSPKDNLATENSRFAVHKLWRTELLCGKGRKSGRKFANAASSPYGSVPQSGTQAN
jgi:hypothetical protein